MSPTTPRRRLSLPLFVVAMMIASAFALIPSSASAAGGLYGKVFDFHYKYNCMSGQTVAFVPTRQVRVAKYLYGEFIGFDTIKRGLRVINATGTYAQDEATQIDDRYDDGEVSMFPVALNIPLRPQGEIFVHYVIEWDYQEVIVDRPEGFVQCMGEPSDRDGDGTPDDLDFCPDAPGSYNGKACPAPGVIKVVSTTASRHSSTIPGTVTLTVTNPDDASVPESYYVSGPGEQSARTKMLADGETSDPITFNGIGSLTLCVSSTHAEQACEQVTIPTDPQLPVDGAVSFTQTCQDMKWSLTNTGWQRAYYVIEYDFVPGNRFDDASEDVWLEPGESASGGTRPMFYYSAVRVRAFNSAGHEIDRPLVEQRWVQPDGCADPIIAPVKVLNWGKMTRKKWPTVTVYSKAYQAEYFFQVKGVKGQHVVYQRGLPKKQRLKIKLPRSPRKKQTICLTVGFMDKFGYRVKYQGIGCHVYRRR